MQFIDIKQKYVTLFRAQLKKTSQNKILCYYA